MLLLDSTHHHAKMPSFNDHTDSNRFNGVLNRVGDLLGQPFLNLQAASEDIHQARNFAESDHAPFGQIGNMNFAEERQHVMLAEAEDFDIFHDNHLVVIHIEKGAAQ